MCDANAQKDSTRCPYYGRMADQRAFTDHRTRCAINFEAQPHPMTSYNYRMYLTTHAAEIMDRNRDVAASLNECGSCVEEPKVFVEAPKPVCDSRVCTFAPNDTNHSDPFKPWDGSYTVPYEVGQ
jgi:hypothetical protein